MTRSDTRNKEIALGRIKRLASSGLPLEPFVRSIFDLINDAIPNSPNRTFHIGGERPDAYVCNSAELNQVIPLHERYYVESSPEASGARFRVNPAMLHRRFPAKTTWMHEELTLPNLYETEGFHTVFKPWGFHHCLMAIFHEAGEYLGCYPIWRSADQRTFNKDDASFISAISPHLAHGLESARVLTDGSRVERADGFATVMGWGTGVLLLDEIGHPIAIDAAARLTFQQTGVFDGISSDAFASPSFSTALDYVMRTLKEIFHEPDGGSFTGPAPVYRLYHHWTGIVLKLRGIRMTSVDGREYTTILVERGETIAARQRRLQFRWGLSDREAEVLALIAQGKTGPEISILLSISHDTARKHLTHVFEKLGVENRTEAALIARDAS